jgi:hypothetical protein
MATMMAIAVYEQNGQIEHPERVAWYQALIQDMTGQTPGVQVVEGQGVAAWVYPYVSSCGAVHATVTQAWAGSVEDALELLCSWVYEDVQADWQQVQAVAGVPVGR